MLLSDRGDRLIHDVGVYNILVPTKATCPILYHTSALFSSDTRLRAFRKQLMAMSYCCA